MLKRPVLDNLICNEIYTIFSYLSVKWTRPTQSLEGTYRCHIYVWTEIQDFELLTASVEVDVKEPTVLDLVSCHF